MAFILALQSAHYMCQHWLCLAYSIPPFFFFFLENQSGRLQETVRGAVTMCITMSFFFSVGVHGGLFRWSHVSTLPGLLSL
jgi:hypothetical protein